MNSKFSKARGQVAVLYAGVAAVLIGAVALGADVAVMYSNWQQAQKVADAAAIAGANYLAGYAWNGTAATGCTSQPDAATTAACTYAVDNGLSASNLTLTEPGGTNIQVVAAVNGLPYSFAQAVGLTSYNVSATAEAAAGGPIGTVTAGLFPVGLQCNSPCNLANLDPGQSVSFGAKFVGGLAPGNWQWLGLGGEGSSTLASNIENGASGSYTLGGTIESAPGNKGNSGPVTSALNDRLSSCPTIADPCSSGGGNPTDIPPNDPCLVVVPAVDFGGCTGNCTMTIEGFAQIYIEPSGTTSTNINGCFVKAITPNSIASASAPSLGAQQVPQLIE